MNKRLLLGVSRYMLPIPRRNSVFFWSEEHARAYRKTAKGLRGIHLTLSQSFFVTRVTQGALFAFPEHARRAAE